MLLESRNNHVQLIAYKDAYGVPPDHAVEVLDTICYIVDASNSHDLVQLFTNKNYTLEYIENLPKYFTEHEVTIINASIVIAESKGLFHPT